MDNLNLNPQLNPGELPPRKSWFSAHKVLGWVFLVVAAAAIVVGLYYWQTVGGIPTAYAPIAHHDPTAGWQTYTNSVGGYSFKYPSDWQAATSNSNSTTALFGPTATGDSGLGGVELMGTLNANQTLADFVKKFNAGVGSGSTSETPQTINGKNAIVSILPLPGLPPSEAKSAAFANSAGQVFNVYLDYVASSPGKDHLLSDFNQLLSTFQFTQ